MRLHIIALLFVSTLVTISACDKISEPYVVHKNIDTTRCPLPEFPVVTNPVKTVLLEDYTGHTCVNCPRAAVTARTLSEQYGDALVVIAVHAGWFARPASNPFDYDFRTQAGDDWDNYFGIGKVGNPNGMVNRKYTSGTPILSPSSWANSIAAALSAAPLINLQVIAEYNNTDDNVCIHTKTTFLQPISDRNLNLSVVIVEDSIIQPQNNNDPAVGPVPEIVDYVHMHVLRGAVNGTWGDAILASGTVSPEFIIKSYPAHLMGFNKYSMVAKHCRVVAFIYDKDTYEVLQAAEAELVH